MKTEARRAALGQAKLALRFQIPSQASSQGIVNPHRSSCYANGPASPTNLPEKQWFALGFQAGRCFEKASASPLASVFSTTHPAFAQRINPVFPVFLFDSFAPAHLTLRAALAVSRAAAQPPGSAHLPRCLVVYILVIRGSKVSLLFVSISVIGG